MPRKLKTKIPKSKDKKPRHGFDDKPPIPPDHLDENSIYGNPLEGNPI